MYLSATIPWLIPRSINSGWMVIRVIILFFFLLINCQNIKNVLNLFLSLLASEAVGILHQRGICQQTNAPIELVASDVLDHYRTYSLLEKLLHSPKKLTGEQLAFQIEPQTSKMLIEM